MTNEDLIAELNEDNQLENVEKSTLSLKAEELKATATTKARELKKTATEKAAQFKEVAGERLAGTKEQFCEYQESLEGAVKKNPLAAIGIAAGVGFLLGLAARGK